MADELAAGMTVQAVAEYTNHNEWTSPIEVEDAPDWKTTYGTTIQNVSPVIDNNDGTITATLYIYRAGYYTLSVLVNGNDVQNSPISDLRVVPSSYFVQNFVPEVTSAVLFAGFEYKFLIQGRDSFKNNIKTPVEELNGGA